MGTSRGTFGSRLGFILAAAGSAIGLGNIWKFPYICGENGGGAFVLVYLICIAVVGLPIMLGEILMGRATQKSPVGAFKALAPRSPWKAVGGLGVFAAFLMLSYYSVVAGWACHYTWTAISGGISANNPDEVKAMFGAVAGDAALNVSWHMVFMALTVAVVIGGVQKGIERWSQILMPALFIMLGILLWQATQQPGFERALDFVFGWHAQETTGTEAAKGLTAAGILEALGHSFFTLSLGMGAMITYGSYLRRDANLVSSAVVITVLDTVIALMACMVLFPITFSYDLGPSGGPGLVFENIPVALAKMPGSQYLAVLFFGLLVFAALTSAVSLLEVVASYFIDEKGWSRPKATLLCGASITVFGIPSALSNSSDIAFFNKDFAAAKANVLGEKVGALTKGNWFDTIDYLVSNWMLPLGGLFIAVFVAWRMSDATRRAEFARTGRIGSLYAGWLLLLRYFVPVVVIMVFLHSIELI